MKINLPAIVILISILTQSSLQRIKQGGIGSMAPVTLTLVLELPANEKDLKI